MVVSLNSRLESDKEEEEEEEDRAQAIPLKELTAFPGER